MAVPRREVQAQLQAILVAGSGQFAHHVALSVLIRCVANRVVGVFRRPETKAVMMLGREDDAFHTGLTTHPSPLFTVESRRIERLQRCIAVAPLAVAERVRSEVDEGVGFQLLPCNLMLSGQRADGCRRVLRISSQSSRNHAGEKE